jgi:TonB family protein
MKLRHLFLFLCVAIAVLAALPANADSIVLEHLRDVYRGKTFILRGFYSGDRLQYDASGTLAGSANSGDWMSEGFVQVKDVRSSHHRLIVEGERQLVIQYEGKEFAFLREKATDIDRRPVTIEAEIDPQNTSADQADAVMAKIFLIANDDFAASVPDYWKPCLRIAAAGNSENFRMSSDLSSVPSAVPGLTGSEMARPAAAEPGNKDALNCATRTRGIKGVHPTAIYQPFPDFSERARQKKQQGNVMLMLVVNKEGLAEDVRILRPLGYGLDEKALSYVRTWKFRPAEMDGEPVAMPLSVEVNFHMY